LPLNINIYIFMVSVGDIVRIVYFVSARGREATGLLGKVVSSEDDGMFVVWIFTRKVRGRLIFLGRAVSANIKGDLLEDLSREDKQAEHMKLYSQFLIWKLSHEIEIPDVERAYSHQHRCELEELYELMAPEISQMPPKLLFASAISLRFQWKDEIALRRFKMVYNSQANNTIKFRAVEHAMDILIEEEEFEEEEEKKRKNLTPGACTIDEEDLFKL